MGGVGGSGMMKPVRNLVQEINRMEGDGRGVVGERERVVKDDRMKRERAKRRGRERKRVSSAGGREKGKWRGHKSERENSRSVLRIERLGRGRVCNRQGCMSIILW